MTVQAGELGTRLTVPRGTPALGTFTIEMSAIYKAESRLKEISVISGEASKELMGFYIDAISETNKYLGWVTYELMQAEKHLKLVKAEVIIDKLPALLVDYRKNGQKDNADIREALMYRDKEYQSQLDIVNGLSAIQEMLEAKTKTFSKAHYACKTVYDTMKQTPHHQLISEVGTLGDIPLGTTNFGGRK